LASFNVDVSSSTQRESILDFETMCKIKIKKLVFVGVFEMRRLASHHLLLSK